MSIDAHITAGPGLDDLLQVDLDISLALGVHPARAWSFGSDNARDVVVKFGTGGNRVGVERHSYHTLHDTPAANWTLDYHGSGTLASHGDFIVVERAKASLDRFYSAPDDLRVALSSLALHSTLEFLCELYDERERRRAPGEQLPIAHRDLKPGNWLLVERENALALVVGDFGFALLPGSRSTNNAAGTLAPEQVTENRPASIETDIWGAALGAWILLHGGYTPYKERTGGWLHEDRAAPDRGHTIALNPPTPADRERVPRTERGRELASLIVHVLSAPEGQERLARMRAIRGRLSELSNAIGPVRTSDELARSIDAHLAQHTPRINAAPRRPESLFAVVNQAPVPRPASDADATARRKAADRTIHAQRRALAMARIRAVGQTFGRLARVGGRVIGRASRGLLLPMSTGLLTAGIAVILGWYQLAPVPDEAVDRLQQLIAAGILALVGVVLLVAEQLRRAATPRGDRLPELWHLPVSAGVVASSATTGVVLLGMDRPFTLSALAVLLAAAPLAAGLQRWLGRRVLRLEQRSAHPHLVTAASATLALILGVSAVVLPFATPLGSALSAHVAETRLAGLVPGMTSDAPVFVNPHAIAVNDRGDVAVVDRVGINRDVVWIVPESAQETPYPVLRTLSWEGPAAEGTLSQIPESSTSGLPKWLASIALGDDAPIRSVTALDFIDDDSLLLLGEDGLTRLDFARPSDGTPQATSTRITEALIVADDVMYTEVLVQGDTAWVNVRGESSPSDGMTAVYPYCAWDGAVGDPWLYRVQYAASDPTPMPVLRSTDRAEQCIDPSAAIYEENGVIRQVRQLPRSGSEPLSFELAALDTPNDGGTLIADLPDNYVYGAKSEGDRLLLNVGYCLTSRALDGSKLVPEPVAIVGAAGSSCPGAPDKSDDEDIPLCGGSGRTPLYSKPMYWQPIAVGGVGRLLHVAAPAQDGCTSTVLRLPADDDQWRRIGRVSQQPAEMRQYALGTTSIMSATRPENWGDSGIHWYAPSLGWILSGPAGTSAGQIYGFARFANRPVERQRYADLDADEYGPGVDDPEVILGTAFRDDEAGDTQSSWTELSVRGWVDGVRRDTRIRLDGLTDLHSVDGKVFFARCGQIGSFEQADLRALPRIGAIAGTDERVDATVTTADEAGRGEIAARIWVGNPALEQGCPAPDEPAAPVDERLVRPAADPTQGEQAAPTMDGDGAQTGWLQIAPLALDVHETTSDNYRFFFAEASVFGDNAASRIRIADTASDRVWTVGYDTDNPAHNDENAKPTGDVLAGDLLNRGLVATDIAGLADGTVAVSTASSRGTGPLLIVKDNRTIVVSAGDREITGVAWDGKTKLIVTDGTRGDVAVLDVSRALNQTAPPLMQLFSWLPFSPAHGVRAP